MIMVYITNILLFLFILLRNNNYLKRVRLKDFEEETKEMIEEGYDFSNLNFNELQLNRGLLSDNILMMIISSLLYLIFMFSFSIVNNYFLFLIISMLISLFFIDIRMKEIPSFLTKQILTLGFMNIILNLILTKEITISYVFSLFIPLIVLGFMYIFIILITNGSIGGGDLHLISTISFFVTTENMMKLLIYPFYMACIYGLILMFLKKDIKNYKFAFGPFIILSFIIIPFL